MQMASSKVVECVPNFSEGRKDATVQAIASAIRDTEGCSLQDVEPGASTNRTVYTFCGSPGAVVEGALRAARVARSLIDMAQHTGEFVVGVRCGEGVGWGVSGRGVDLALCCRRWLT